MTSDAPLRPGPDRRRPTRRSGRSRDRARGGLGGRSEGAADHEGDVIVASRLRGAMLRGGAQHRATVTPAGGRRPRTGHGRRTTPDPAPRDDNPSGPMVSGAVYRCSDRPPDGSMVLRGYRSAAVDPRQAATARPGEPSSHPFLTGMRTEQQSRSPSRSFPRRLSEKQIRLPEGETPQRHSSWEYARSFAGQPVAPGSPSRRARLFPANLRSRRVVARSGPGRCPNLKYAYEDRLMAPRLAHRPPRSHWTLQDVAQGQPYTWSRAGGGRSGPGHSP